MEKEPIDKKQKDSVRRLAKNMSHFQEGIARLKGKREKFPPRGVSYPFQECAIREQKTGYDLARMIGA